MNKIIKLLLFEKQNAKYESNRQNVNFFWSKYFDFNFMWKFYRNSFIRYNDEYFCKTSNQFISIRNILTTTKTKRNQNKKTREKKIKKNFEFCENNIAIIHCCKNFEFERIDFFVIISISLIENDNIFRMRIDLMNTWWNFDANRIQMWFFFHFFDIRKICFRVSKILISARELHAVEESVQLAIS